ncbi:hypothetical protein [Clostridium oceanicum]|uniref:ABC-2 family transporter protein n=1 Tax=Clostridium oceanicum TaxID=1543 RepID=A0ABP3UZ24_9CLOT
MISYIKDEFKRGFFSKNSIICFGVILSIFFINFLEFIRLGVYNFKNTYDFIDVFLYCRNIGRFSMLSIISPLLAAIVYSSSYLQDKRSGYLDIIYSKENKYTYVLTRLIVNAVVSGVIIVLSSLVMLIILGCTYGINIININPSLNIQGPFNYIYYSNKWLYCIIILVNSFIFYAIFSTLALGISTIINNKYISYLIPFFYCVLSETLFITLKVYPLNVTCLFNLKEFTAQWIIMYEIILFSIGVLLFYFGILYKNEKLDNVKFNYK